MQCIAEPFTYTWQSDWAKLPPMTGHAHHGFTWSKQGYLVSGHATDPEVLILSPDGELIRSFRTPVEENHGLTLAEENGEEVLWIADNVGGKFVTVTMEGELIREFDRSHFGVADDEKFSPTALAWDPVNDVIWVTNGYGTHDVHRLGGPDFAVDLTLDGETGLGRFRCPHWIHIDTRAKHPRLYVADCSRHRIQVFNVDGSFSHGIDEGLKTPSVFGSFDDILVVGELNARVVLLDKDDKIIGYLGAGVHHCDKPGWPNRMDADDNKIPPQFDIPEGEFNSPHGMAVDPAGNIYVSEWLLGDRYTKLHRHA